MEVMMKDLFKHYQENLISSFNLIRNKHVHSGNKGSSVEQVLRDFITKYIPKNLSVGHGEIIDSFNKRSRETDIIIFNELQPFIENLSDPNLFMAECVMCVGEVKTDLSTLEDSIRKCYQFKSLKIKPTVGQELWCSPYDQKRFYDKRAFFVFAFDSSISVEKIIEKLTFAYRDKEIVEQIDAIFLLNRGAIINFGEGTGSYQFLKKETRTPYTGFVQTCTDQHVIKNFLTWLITTIPRMTYFTHPLIHYLFDKV